MSIDHLGQVKTKLLSYLFIVSLSLEKREMLYLNKYQKMHLAQCFLMTLGKM
jgi:hypothetical protein